MKFQRGCLLRKSICISHSQLLLHTGRRGTQTIQYSRQNAPPKSDQLLRNFCSQRHLCLVKTYSLDGQLPELGEKIFSCHCGDGAHDHPRFLLLNFGRNLAWRRVVQGDKGDVPGLADLQEFVIKSVSK